MLVPIIPGDARPEDAIPALLNPTNNVQELMATVQAGIVYELVPLKNRLQVIVQVQYPATAKLWVRWDGGIPAPNIGMLMTVGMLFGQNLADNICVKMVAETDSVQVYIQQAGGKYA